MGVQRLAILHGPVNRPSADVAPARTSSQLSTLYRTDVVFRVPLCTLLKIFSASASCFYTKTSVCV